jgi:DNA adenine methylase
MSVTKPCIKWVGGKTQIIEEVLSLFPVEINNYYEPFVGGGSVLFGLLSYVKAGNIRLTGKIYASDLNVNLIALYLNIRDRPSELIREISELVTVFNGIATKEVTEVTTQKVRKTNKVANITDAIMSKESFYYWIRLQFNSLTTDEKMAVRASAMMLFLNKTCFRGVYREGPNGFNVPYGNYTNPSIYDQEHILAVSELIKNVIFFTSDYATPIANAVNGDFLYFDPPYAPENETSFVGYTSDGFRNHEALFTMCDGLRRRNIKFLMSNSHVKLVTDAFRPEHYTIRVISCKRMINSKKPSSKTDEVLITNQ